MSERWRSFKLWLKPSFGRGVRDLIALFSIVQGCARLLSSATAQPVSILPSWLYGGLLIISGVGLLLTGADCWRSTYIGRVLAISACGLWLLLAFDVFGAWASFGGACVMALFAANEVRYNYAC